MQMSYSRVSSFESCPYKWRLHYLDKLETLPDDNPANPLILGTALHRGIEVDAETAVREYLESYPIATDQHIEEVAKLEDMIVKARRVLPEGRHEVPVHDRRFVGFIDLLAEGCIYDFKYCNPNGISRYMGSAQLHLYKYYYEKNNRGQHIDHLYYVFVPKTAIRPKKTESIAQFRARLREELAAKDVEVVEVPYDPVKVIGWLETTQDILQAKDYPKHESGLCRFCEFEKYCQEGIDYMILPKNERRTVTAVSSKKIWIYGAAFAGKTTLANAFPNPLMLNTDGNIKFVDAPYIAIHDEVKVEGRITRKTLAWQVFKDAIDELEKRQNGFETIVVDLVEDMYEYCRLYMYDKKGWEHESDDSFKAWDMVRTEFLSTMKRLMNMDYPNIVLISHEDATKDVTKRNGSKITAIKPNLGDKVANKLAGMVDIVARAVVEEGEHRLQFKADAVTFGGGRLKLSHTDIPMDYAALVEVYGAGKPASAPKRAKEQPKAEEVPAEIVEEPETPEEPAAEEQPTKRVRKRRETVEEAPADIEPEQEEAPAEPVKRVRKRRVREAE